MRGLWIEPDIRDVVINFISIITKKTEIKVTNLLKQIAEYVDFYNTKRLHSSLYYLMHEDFMLGRMKEKLEVRENKLTEARKNRIEMRNAV